MDQTHHSTPSHQESNESDQAVTQTTGTHDTVSLPTMEEKTHPSRSVPSLIPTGRPTAYSDMALGGGRRGGRGVRRSITMDSLAATINSNISTSPSSTSFLPAPTTSEKEMSKGGEGGSLLVVEGLDRASSMVRAALMQVKTFHCGSLNGFLSPPPLLIPNDLLVCVCVCGSRSFCMGLWKRSVKRGGREGLGALLSSPPFPLYQAYLHLW